MEEGVTESALVDHEEEARSPIAVWGVWRFQMRVRRWWRMMMRGEPQY